MSLEPLTRSEATKKADKIIYYNFNNRDHFTCDHCERQYDDSICETCFRKRLHREVVEALLEIDRMIKLKVIQ